MIRVTKNLFISGNFVDFNLYLYRYAGGGSIAFRNGLFIRISQNQIITEV